jgi:hypothetical protein
MTHQPPRRKYTTPMAQAMNSLQVPPQLELDFAKAGEEVQRRLDAIELVRNALMPGTFGDPRKPVLEKASKLPGDTAIIAQTPNSADGPRVGGLFRWRGEDHQMPPRVARLVVALWHASDRTLDSDAAYEAVYLDDAELGPEDGLASVRRDANSFFRKANVPFKIKVDTRHRCAAMLDT